jgi:hypothetical protein
LRVEKVAGHWCLRDDHKLWFNFGTHQGDAKHALEVIQQHEFNRIGYVGQAETVMIYFLGGTPERSVKSLSPVVFSPLEAMYARQLTPPSLALLDEATGEEKLPFDWRRVEAKRDGQHWRLMAGRECLADFARDGVAAREAHQAVLHYRFTERCMLGESATPLTYFLVNGQAPHGVPFGAQNTPFHPDRLTIKQIDGQWLICEDKRPILRAGDTEAEAKRALLVIQKYRFDALCVIGTAEQASLRFLVREH